MTEPDDATKAACRELVEAAHLELQREHGLSWSTAAHCMIAYGLDSLHVSPGPDGVLAELRRARKAFTKAIDAERRLQGDIARGGTLQ